MSFDPATREKALGQYGEVLKIQDNVNLRLRRISLLLEDRRWEEAAQELQKCPVPEDPQLLREQAHLYLWLGNLPAALKTYDLCLKKAPEDRVARLEKARVLTYLERGPEALEILNRLRMEQPGDLTVRVAAVEAYLSSRDFPKALALAQKELEPLPDLSRTGGPCWPAATPIRRSRPTCTRPSICSWRISGKTGITTPLSSSWPPSCPGCRAMRT